MLPRVIALIFAQHFGKLVLTMTSPNGLISFLFRLTSFARETADSRQMWAK